MHKFHIRSTTITTAKNHVRCTVCRRRPRAGSKTYEITSTTTEADRGAYVFHHGFTDTKKCADFYVIKEMGK